VIDWDAETRRIIQHHVNMARKDWAVDQARHSVGYLQKRYPEVFGDLGKQVKEQLNAVRTAD
jgi:hypothetical protein